MSSVKSRKAATKLIPVTTMRPLVDQLTIITSGYRAASKKSLTDGGNRRRLRGLALGTVFLIDEMSA